MSVTKFKVEMFYINPETGEAILELSNHTAILVEIPIQRAEKKIVGPFVAEQLPAEQEEQARDPWARLEKKIPVEDEVEAPKVLSTPADPEELPEAEGGALPGTPSYKWRNEKGDPL